MLWRGDAQRRHCAIILVVVVVVVVDKGEWSTVACVSVSVFRTFGAADADEPTRVESAHAKEAAATDSIGADERVAADCARTDDHAERRHCSARHAYFGSFIIFLLLIAVGTSIVTGVRSVVVVACARTARHANRRVAACAARVRRARAARAPARRRRRAPPPRHRARPRWLHPGPDAISIFVDALVLHVVVVIVIVWCLPPERVAPAGRAAIAARARRHCRVRTPAALCARGRAPPSVLFVIRSIVICPA